MPHLQLSLAGSASTFGIREILEELVAAFSQVETVDPGSLKAYVTELPLAVFGEGHPDGMVHCTARVLSGRPLELRQRMGQVLAEVLRKHYGDDPVKITVEIREMDRDTYVK